MQLQEYARRMETREVSEAIQFLPEKSCAANYASRFVELRGGITVGLRSGTMAPGLLGAAC